VEGPPGAGKSATIWDLAHRSGNAAGVIELHLDDSIDSKSLLGTYVCTDVPGEFTWSPGPLTQAVVHGRYATCFSMVQRTCPHSCAPCVFDGGAVLIRRLRTSLSPLPSLAALGATPACRRVVRYCIASAVANAVVCCRKLWGPARALLPSM
jgi:hypothetical protein